MNPKQAQRIAIISVMAAALLVFILALGGFLANEGYPVPGQSFFRGMNTGGWTVFTVLGFAIILAAEAYIWWRPAMLIQVLELTPFKTGMNLHVRCRSCGVVTWVEDTGQRPLAHFCPSCGKEGKYGGDDAVLDARDFIYTQVEVKLGCRNCKTTFTVPEPLARPLYTECPNCHAHGVLPKDARTVQADESQVSCIQCGYAFTVYEAGNRKYKVIACPRCKFKMDRSRTDAPFKQREDKEKATGAAAAADATPGGEEEPEPAEEEADEEGGMEEVPEEEEPPAPATNGDTPAPPTPAPAAEKKPASKAPAKKTPAKKGASKGRAKKPSTR